MTKDDELFFLNRIKAAINKLEEERNYLNIQFYNKLNGRSYFIDNVPEIDKTLYTLQSIKEGKIVGFNFPNFICLCNNAIEYYFHHWIFIEQALKTFGLWDQMIAIDKKKTFSTRRGMSKAKRPSARPKAKKKWWQFWK